MRCLLPIIALATGLLPLTALAQRSGVLIGVAVEPANNPLAAAAGVMTPRFETIWVVRSEQPFRTVVPDLLVPRRDGFWRLGVLATCDFSPDEQNERTVDVIWRARLGATDTVTTDADCQTEPTGADTDTLRKASVDTTRTACGYQSVRIVFASPDFLGLRSTSGALEDCGPPGFRWYDRAPVHRFFDHESLPLDSVVGPIAQRV